MGFSEVLNLILGGGLMTAFIAIVTLKATVRKANAEAEKANADAETVRIDNTEHATRILIQNIVEPLKEELSATREQLQETEKALQATKRKWPGFAKPSTLLTAVSIVMTVLFCTGCASSRRSTQETKAIQTKESADSLTSVRKGVTIVGIPKSEVKMTIPMDSLRKMPSGSTYTKKSGRANVSVSPGSSGNIIVYASCDSLQQLVEWYEQELVRIRSQTTDENDTVQTVKERRSNPVEIVFIFIAGVLSGIVITFLIRKK